MRRPALVPALLAAGIAFPVCAQDRAAIDLFTRPDKGHCAACHQVPEGSGPASQNDAGPALTGARMRSLGKPTLAALIRDPTLSNPATVMPPYGRHQILDETEIARLVEYLHALP